MCIVFPGDRIPPSMLPKRSGAKNIEAEENKEPSVKRKRIEISSDSTSSLDDEIYNESDEIIDKELNYIYFGDETDSDDDSVGSDDDFTF